MDKYDKAIEFLTDNPNRICHAWRDPGDFDDIGGCLFQYAGNVECGCLTQVRSGSRAETEELTKEIRADVRIPKDKFEINVKHLPVFAEWQRKLDVKLCRG